MNALILPLNINVNTDAEILAAIRTEERERALAAFVRTHEAFVYSVALRHLRHHEDARDVAQETFLKAIKGLDRFKGDSTLQTWLYRITVNTAISLQRKRKFLSYFAVGEAEGEKDVAAHYRGADEEAYTSDFEKFFSTVLNTLPAKQRETFCLRYFDELSYEEISEMVGTSVGALKANYHWAVKKLAEQIKDTEYYANWKQP